MVLATSRFVARRRVCFLIVAMVSTACSRQSLEPSGVARGSMGNEATSSFDGSMGGQDASLGMDSGSHDGISEGSAVCPPLPEAPVFEAPPGFVVNLQPTADCVHPEVVADCADGYCRIPAGCFIMGAPRDEFAAARDLDVQVQVTLTRAFEIGTVEVTRQMWSDEGFDFPLREFDVGGCQDQDCPISNVNLYETVTFINQYSEQRGLAPCYELRGCSGTFGSGPVCHKPGERPGVLECESTANTEDDQFECEGLFTTAASVYECEGYRLPTEAEWEYAARAGTRTAFWTGPIAWGPVHGDCTCDPNLEPIAWYCYNSGLRQHPVGKKPPNPWGLHDILGNVDEWTADAIYWLGYGEGVQVDPAGYWWEVAGKVDGNLMPIAEYDGELREQRRVAQRGGNYTYAATSNKASARNLVVPPVQGGSPLGFRMARTLLGQTQ